VSTIEAPTTISRERVLDFIRSLGIDPDTAISLMIDPSRVELVMFATNEEGKRFCHPDGNDAAKHTISLEMK
jgi:hypothetical protein